MNYTTSKEGVSCIFDKDHLLVGLVHKDPKSRHNVFYKCEPMSLEEIESFINSDVIKTKSNEKNSIEA